MTSPSPSQSATGDNPYATLHARSHIEPHHDSEEAVQFERRRVPVELESTRNIATTTRSADTPEGSATIRSSGSLYSRDAATQRANATSQEGLTRPEPNSSDAHIQPTTSGASEVGRASARSSTRPPHWYNPVVTFWTTHVCPSLEEGAYRDHLALERTFLGYLRTSLILVMTGVLTSQLFHLQRSPTPNPNYGFYVIGRPLSAVFISMAIVVLLIGAVRFWRIQRQLLRGKTLVGGWEVLSIMVLSALLLIGTFALLLGIDIDKTYLNG
ncbi:hypothetical protein T440DRAFT_402658 [Plenodomus tracheiphilus IPT5]|uniref:DUF202 domain-containing protein n=1 Tax=Plenodomus tracheiphilus IPT5 TaxID=1408161 RepID=A0A6A7AXE7_9PLEO|nr:hypothetical protein T440DRAFT_402658 [Plenodomus tracheiphilus IPT5]